MSRVTVIAAVCAVGLVTAAAVVVVDGNQPPGTTVLTSDEPSTTATSTTPTSPVTTSTPAPTTTTVATTVVPPPPPGALSAADGAAALPTVGDTYVESELAAQLATVCEGASFDLLGADTSYASLKTADDDPLRYLDAVVAVFPTDAAAAGAYSRITGAMVDCPTTRTATPPPSEDVPEPRPVQIEGELRPDILVADLPAVQWVQLQTAEEPPSQLRTAITVVAVENALVAVSMDQDAETGDVDEIADASIIAAVLVAQSLIAAAAA